MRSGRTSMTQREYLSRVRERDRTLAGRVKGRKHEDEECDDAQMRTALLGNVEGEAGCQQRPRHLRESEEEQGAAPVGVDGEEGRDGKEEVHGAEAERGEQRFDGTGACSSEDRGGVESLLVVLDAARLGSWRGRSYDDVDTAHLLGDHDGPAGQSGAADAWDGEELPETRDIAGGTDDFSLNLNLRVDVEQISGRQ